MAKFSFCFLMFVAVLGITFAVQRETKTYYPTQYGNSYQSGYLTQSNEPRVVIDRINGMSPSMQLDASDFLKRAYSLSASGDRCSIFRQLYAEKYPEYTWHVIMYRAYSIRYIKSIELSVGNDHYVLFATKK